MKLKPRNRLAELGTTIGDELLKVHVSYGPLVQKLLRRFNRSQSSAKSEIPIKAFAHITGGGCIDNIPRVLPKDCDVIIRKGSWDVLPIFQMIQEKGHVPERELYQVFNMGIGMIAIVDPQKAEAAVQFIRAQKHRAWLIGEVIKGEGRARVI
jgi:phosphoribosylformylglycinamidine cyclo-ligase